MKLTRTSAPVADIGSSGLFTVTELKTFLWIVDSDSSYDLKLEQLFIQCLSKLEDITSRSLIQSTWLGEFSCFPKSYRGEFHLPLGFIHSVTQVEYFKEGQEATATRWNDYTATTGENGLILPKTGEQWPTDYNREMKHPIQVTFEAGWESGKAPDYVSECLMSLIYDSFNSLERSARTQELIDQTMASDEFRQYA